MEQRIKEYEEFIKKRVDKPDEKLISYHREMLANFQHERLVHLIIMLFFVAITFVVTAICIFTLATMKSMMVLEFLPMIIAAVLLWVLSFFYVRHYYFLENHVQALYNISKELYENSAKSEKVNLKDLGEKIVKKVGKVLSKKEKK